ncbi:single-stranded DNA-binding protein [uncultured Deinococcus sp.]|uniref:single-stranded DNA-binding protein n=1 Tax=uncultured Deinococcus sp. TaxID=158789 RepID=UPI0025E9470D|nr:single-stranded DNA-binding protein [uncultured Deinococcus sp.]
MAEVGVALNQVYTKDGQREEKVTYIKVVAWRELADELSALPKGSPIIVDGALMYEHWKDKKSGDDRSTLKVEAQRIVCVARPGTVTKAPVSVTAPSVPDQDAKAATIPDTVTDAPDAPDEEDLPF